MKLKGFMKKIQKIIDEHPEALNYDVIHFRGGIKANIPIYFSPVIGEYKQLYNVQPFTELKSEFDITCHSNKFNTIRI